jgi:hypothetical protein
VALTQQFVNGPVDADDLNSSSIPVVTATTDIISPFGGQLIFNTTDNLVYRYDSGTSSWVGVTATGGATTTQTHEARYEQKGSAQSISSSTDTKMKFETAWTTCDDIVASGTNNTDFLLTRAGEYVISFGVRYLGNSGGGERHIFLQFGTTFVTANRLAQESNSNVGSAPVTLAAATVTRIAANTSVFVGLFQNAGTSTTLDVGFGAINHIGIVWLRA